MVAQPAARGILRGRRPLTGWTGRTVRAARFAVSHPETWSTALAAFLVRGGIVLFLLPIVVLPSVIGIAQGFGLDAFTIAREPTPWFLTVVGVAIALLVAWLVAAAWLGGASDAWLVAVARVSEPRACEEAPHPHPLIRMAAIRAVCLVPVVAAAAYAGVRIYDAAYFELLTPVDLAAPLVLRVVADAWDAVLLVVAVWLLEEALAAIAVRQLLIGHRGAAGALAGAVRQVAGRPISTLATIVTTFAGSVVVVGAPLALSAAAFDWCRIAARTLMPVTLGVGAFSTTRDFRAIVVILAAGVLAAAWLAALALAGITAAWRSAAFTAEVEADLAARTESRGPETPGGTFESTE